jgi:hypothetical protein
MAKTDLEAAWKRILKKTEKFRENKVDIQQHVYPVISADIQTEVLKALSSLDVPKSSLVDSAVEKRVDKYTDILYHRFKALSSATNLRSVKYTVKGSSSNFIVVVTSLKGTASTNTDVFIKINDVRTRKGSDVGGLSTALKSLNREEYKVLLNMGDKSTPLGMLRAGILLDIFNIDTNSEKFDPSVDSRELDVIMGYRQKKDPSVRHGGLLQLGHLEGFAVVQKRAQDIASKVKKTHRVNIGTGTLSKFISTRAASISALKGQFELEVEIDLNNVVLGSDEFFLDNQYKEEENTILESLKEEFFSEKQKWLDQRGSDSFKDVSLEVGYNELIDKLNSSFSSKRAEVKYVRGKKAIKTDKSPSSVTKKITATASVTKSNTKGEKLSNTSKKVRKNTSSATTNWSSLLPIINSKLTPRVIANMRLPSLVNRTGRFAQSAEVVRIEETREGSPSFVFNYERDPYDVFDRTLGRAPWNTPERDPRALVDKSVREIVREMAIGRFYTRRA